ncbi:MAG: hypothetical protein DWH91_02255 [Planctomycetota bacterium]|nr:MAG: hypothetical protein DWH91_02255 [Planctomycetota bacterium]
MILRKMVPSPSQAFRATCQAPAIRFWENHSRIATLVFETTRVVRILVTRDYVTSSPPMEDVDR